MSAELIINSNPFETRVALVENGQVAELYVERSRTGELPETFTRDGSSGSCRVCRQPSWTSISIKPRFCT